MSTTKDKARAFQGGGAFAKEDVEKLYQDSDVASSYDQDRFQSYRGRLKTMLETDAVCALIAREKHDRILDIATGTGRFALEMVTRFPDSEIVGIDQSAAMLKEARAKSSLARFLEMDAFNTTFDDKCFDVVTSVLFIRHFENEYRQQVYAEIHRLLRPGGVLIMDAANRAHHQTLIEERPVYDKIYSKDDFRQELENNRFVVERFLGIPVCARGVSHIVRLRKREAAQLKLERALNTMLWGFDVFTRRSPNWIAKCRKIS